MFIDGVYQANRDAIDVAMLDIERIEVVKGPQSALFGHSTFAGLIHYIAAKPTETLSYYGWADAGTDDLYGFRSAFSGPISGSLKARVAASWQSANGTWENAASPGQHVGNTRGWAFAGTLATRDAAGPLSASLSVRYGENRTNQPPFYGLDYRSFNCGGHDPKSGTWSYFCGDAPLPSRVSLSPDLPDSRTRTGQVGLHLALDLGDVEILSDTSYYSATAATYRDFDGGPEGELFGVCTVGFNCAAPLDLGKPVNRLQRSNTVQQRRLVASEYAQELRLLSVGEHSVDWQLGAAVYRTRSRFQFAYGAERGELAANERFTSLNLVEPLRVGSLAAMNSAIEDGPNSAQVVQSDSIEHRRTMAAFATLESGLSEQLRLRGEFRANWERLGLDSRKANFTASFGRSMGARSFFDLTGRVGLEYRPTEAMLLYGSYARGSRSGGINAQPSLLPEEQTYAPESNWTGELGVKYAGDGWLRSAQVTAYHIDWRGTQIIGLTATPGIAALIQRNTRGVRTWGVEFAGEIRPTEWIGLDFALSYANPRFKPGSEDPGSNAFCGLSQSSIASSFCTIRPSWVNPRQLVPDVSGNRLARAAKTSLAMGFTLIPAFEYLHGATLRLGVSYQGNVFERQVNGLYYGERLLLYQPAVRLTRVRDSQTDESLNQWRPAFGGRDHGISDRLAG